MNERGRTSDGGSVPTHRLEAQRRKNRDDAASLGFEPYGARRDDLIGLAAARAAYDAEADAAHQAAGKAAAGTPGYEDRRPRVRIAGRTVLHRDNGNLLWLLVRDHTGDLQVALSKKDCDERSFALAKLLDLGDVVVAAGPLMKTRTGELTVWANSLEMAAKCLTPPPEKHAGLHDVEIRYRRRYVDLWATPESMRVAVLRSSIVSRLRRFLDDRGFLEVETPVLQQLAGGAAARPFVTRMNALDMNLFLRIAPELYLKRLLVGGLGRVYELSRNFRNEGLDRSHNPEFTSLEIYQAFGDYGSMMELAESLVRDLATHVAGASGLDRPVLAFGDLSIDYAAPFERVRYAELFERALGFPLTDGERARKEAAQRGLKHQGLDDVLVVNELFEEVAEKRIDPARPTFVLDYPSAISPLTRPSRRDAAVAERWDLFIGGMEIGPAYTELNDPDVQESKFREQLRGIDDEEQTFRTFDADFIEALKVGMPPAGGLGLGIDRLVMLLTNQRSIRDVLLFPMMKPEGEAR